MGGPLNYEEIEEIYIKYPFLKKIKNFVETGTYKGDTSVMASNYYDSVYTIEIVQKLYDESVDRFTRERIDNVFPYLGDSLVVLPKILEEITKTDGAVYFIDAHQSGPDTSFNQIQQVPLIEELKLILKEGISPSIYIFDDVRFWRGHKQQAWDWEHITESKIIQLFDDYGINIIDSYVKNDRFFVMTI